MLYSRDSEPIQRVLYAQQRLIESDQDLRRLEREAHMSGDPTAHHKYEAALIRSGDILGAARHHLRKPGINYLRAYGAKKHADDAFNDSDESWARSDAADKHLEERHREYRQAVHNFRESHRLQHPREAYWNKPTHASHVGADALAGSALPSHEEGGLSPEHHAHAVVSAVYHDPDEPKMVNARESHHAENALAAHYPNHQQNWHVVEHNPDNTPNYVSFNGLGKKKQHPGETTRETTQFRRGLPIRPD